MQKRGAVECFLAGGGEERSGRAPEGAARKAAQAAVGVPRAQHHHLATQLHRALHRVLDQVDALLRRAGRARQVEAGRQAEGSVQAGRQMRGQRGGAGSAPAGRRLGLGEAARRQQQAPGSKEAGGQRAPTCGTRREMTATSGFFGSTVMPRPWRKERKGRKGKEGRGASGSAKVMRGLQFGLRAVVTCGMAWRGVAWRVRWCWRK